MSAPDASSPYYAEDSSGQLMAVSGAFLVLTIFFASLRVAAARLKRRKSGAHDIFSYIALIFIIGECVLGILEVDIAGVGRHVPYLLATTPHKLDYEWVLLYPIEILYISSFTFAKLSILCLYQQLFVTKTTRNVTWALMTVVVMTWTAETLSAIFQCKPITYLWDKASSDGYCVNQIALYAYWSIPNLITDAVMIVLPLPTVWNLRAPRAQKVGLTVTFLLGSIGLLACIYRFVIFITTSAGLLTDPTWESMPLQIWTIIEPSMYFIAGVLPTLRALAAIMWTQAKSFVTSSSMPSSTLPDHEQRSAYPGDAIRKQGIIEHRAKKGKFGRAFGLNSTLFLGLSSNNTRMGTTTEDDITLVECMQEVSAESYCSADKTHLGLPPSTGEPSDNAITRTHEVVVTREAV